MEEVLMEGASINLWTIIFIIEGAPNGVKCTFSFSSIR